MDVKQQIAELTCAQLAADLGLSIPQPAIVDIPQGFEAVLSQADVIEAVRASPGLNFGSLHLGASFTTWPTHRTPYGTQRDQAAAIFAFDALVQNPDRRASNPNLWVKAEQIGVYDHEQAFSFLFLPIIGGPSQPWSLASQSAGSFQFLSSHVFYQPLRGATFDLKTFEEKLGGLSDAQIEGYVAAVPEGWRSGHDLCDKIAAYLRAGRAECRLLLSFVQQLLR